MNEEQCCPRFDPSAWDGKVLEWTDKKFIRDHVFTVFHMPMNFGTVMKRLDERVRNGGTSIPDNLCLSDHTSPWKMDVYLAVDQEVPGADNVRLTGKFYCRVYEGPFSDTGKWCTDFEEHAKEKGEIFALCEDLYGSDYTEEAFVVSFWGANFKRFVEPGDLATFERWIDAYINNWAKCDGFCNHAVGDFMVRFPDRIPELKRWARSENRWMRRAAAVTLIVPAKKGLFLADAFEIADILLTDKDDMVQKGYGWLLKEESRTRQQEVFTYVMANKERMPRTALRYAIELMPKEMRAKAMER
ncbi:MAG TPA: DNA alkylation repair protein [Methanomicrobiales archaeon]|nr:DNA alkylation repair protein [Methanomicrobiales archaeon]